MILKGCIHNNAAFFLNLQRDIPSSNIWTRLNVNIYATN